MMCCLRHDGPARGAAAGPPTAAETLTRPARRGVGGAVVALLAALPAWSQGIPGGAGQMPVVDPAVSVTEKLGAVVPRDLELVDERRNRVVLGDYLGRERPVVLNLGYFGCPALCGEVTNALGDALARLDMQAGEHYEVLSVSVDPREKPSLAHDKKQVYLERYAVPGGGDHWHFLTGEEAAVRTLADAVGWGYEWDDMSGQYLHDAALVFLSPSGKVTRYLYGKAYRTRDMRLAVLEASEGTVGSTWDRILLSCYGYDPERGTYVLPMAIMQIGGALTLLGLAGMLVFLFTRERRPRGSPEPVAQPVPSQSS